jgi:Undecaprenyl-phosphate glucose phosphotransferase
MEGIQTGASRAREIQSESSVEAVSSVAAPAAAEELSSGRSGPSAGTSGLLELSSLILRVVELAVLALAALVCTQLLLDFLSPERARDYRNAVLVAAVFYAIFSEAIGAYDLDARFSVRSGWSRVALAWFSTFVFMLTLGFLFKASETFSRVWAVSWFAAGGGALLIFRTGMTLWLKRLLRHGAFNQRVAIFGAGKQGARFVQHVQKSERLSIDLVGFYDDKAVNGAAAGETNVPFRGGLDELLGSIRAGQIDQVMVALPWSADDRIQEIVAKLAVTPVRIRLAPDMANFMYLQRPFVMLDGLPVMTLFERPISGADQMVKKVEDMVLATALTILLSPLLLLIALLIKLDSSGPVFFRQPREGFNNQTFCIWKFRSMYTDQSQVQAIEQARKADPRVTRVGRLLRRTSLDELPQLFNVLSGEMSLVGPRPHAPSTRAGDRLFADVVSTYAARHKVKPGITGWAQVNGWRGETDTEEKLLARVEHDLHYIDNWSVLFDLAILFRTFTAFFSSRAY